MSIGRWWGGVPSNFTVPVIFPSAAALTVCPECNITSARRESLDNVTANLYPLFMECFSWSLLAFGLGRRFVGIDGLQAQFFGDLRCFSFHRLQRAKVKN